MMCCLLIILIVSTTLEINQHGPEIKKTAESDRSDSYLDILLSFEVNNLLNTQLYDKRDDFHFQITNISEKHHFSYPAYGVFVSYLKYFARRCSKYDDFINRTRRSATELLVQGPIIQRKKSLLLTFSVAIWGPSFQNDQRHSGRRLKEKYIDTKYNNIRIHIHVLTPICKFRQSSHSTSFHETVATDVECKQEMPSSDTWYLYEIFYLGVRQFWLKFPWFCLAPFDFDNG